jgi:hypothetical protein
VHRSALTLFLLAATLAACGGRPPPGPTTLAPQALAALRDLVFADQDLDDVVALQKDSPVDDPASPWPRLATAARLRREDPEAAEAELEQVLALPGLETRVQLWTWTALRQLDALPDEESADVVQGVVMEMPADGGVDTLAVFRDGTMRYFDHAGKAVFWDARRGASGAGTAELVRKPIALAEQMKVEDRGPIVETRPPWPPGSLRVSFLAFGGVRQRETRADALREDDPLAPFMKAASAIMQTVRQGAK